MQTYLVMSMDINKIDAKIERARKGPMYVRSFVLMLHVLCVD